MFYSLVFKARKKRVKKYPATQASIFSAIKKAMMVHKPELKMGDGGGCMIFWAVAKTTRNALKAIRATTNKEEAGVLLPKITSMLDRLAKKNIIHKKKASNLKSSLVKHVSSL